MLLEYTFRLGFCYTKTLSGEPSDIAPLMRGSLDANLAAVVSLQGKRREVKVLHERALPQLIRARNPRLLANARSNLGLTCSVSAKSRKRGKRSKPRWKKPNPAKSI